MRTVRLALLLLSLLPGLPVPVAAQDPVELRGRGDPLLDARIRGLLRDPQRTLWIRDTLIARTDTVREAVLVVGSAVRIEGVVLGDLAAVGADLFVRPTARVAGNVLNLAGGWYASDLATVTGKLDSRPNAPYAVERAAAGRIVIRGTRNPRVLAMRPLLPGYDRVDGLSPGAAVRLLLPVAGRLEPSAEVWARYRSERGELDGGASLTLARGRTSISGGAERTSLTNEDWIRGNLSNGLSYLWDGTDIRDYYQADRFWAQLHRVLERGERTTEIWLRAQVEDARSLSADEPWTLFQPDSLRPNRPVDEGRITSTIAGGTVAWRRPTFEVAVTGAAEVAIDAFDSDFTFSSYRLDLDWAMLALRDHTLEIDAHAQGPLPFSDLDCSTCTSDRRIPRQRWSQVGGSGTMPTFGDAAFQGDRVVFVESRYGIPLGPRLRMPFLGMPTLELLHATGMAWTQEQARRFEQNVGVRLRYNVVYFRFITNPERFTAESEFSVGVVFPRRAYAWQTAGGFF